MCYPIIIRKQEFPVTIREKRTPISQFAAALRQRSPQEKRDLLVADTLDSLCRHCDLYDAARVSSNPFHPELLRTIAAADLSSEALFSLFECLAVLVHLRKLAHPAIPLDAAEEELLFQFEHSGEWLPDDTTLVADWYWRTSPLSSATKVPPFFICRNHPAGWFFIAVRCPDVSRQHKKRPAGAGLFLQDHSSRYRTRLIR